MTGGTSHAATNADAFTRAWIALRHDPSIQFNLSPPLPPPKAPAWLETLGRWIFTALKPVGRALRWIGSFVPDAPYARILFWLVIGLAAAAFLYALYHRIREGEWRLRLKRTRARSSFSADDGWMPDEAGAKSWLEEADALAREGRFAEAIHHLLFRSIEDIARRRPTVVRPALTSRELARSQRIPQRARDLFASIAKLVENSLFGEEPVAEGDWLAARAAYSDFALPTVWRS